MVRASRFGRSRRHPCYSKPGSHRKVTGNLPTGAHSRRAALRAGNHATSILAFARHAASERDTLFDGAGEMKDNQPAASDYRATLSARFAIGREVTSVATYW